MDLPISIIAILISAGTAWFTIFHRGTVKMSRPNFFALIPEDSPFGGWLKFFMRVLLFSTGKRGRVIERIYLNFKHDQQTFQFHYWMYGQAEQLVIGSGVFVGSDGVGANHHFVPTSSLSSQAITAGLYEVEIHAHLLGDKRPILLHTIHFELNEEEAAAIRTSKDKAVFFTWDEESQKYKSRIDRRRSKGHARSVSGSGEGPFSWE